MKVAVVFYRIDPEVGGGFTFSRTVLDAVRQAAPQTGHEFIFYTALGAGQEASEFRQIPANRRHRWHKGALRAMRTVQDLLGASRWRFRTWFERSLDTEGVDMVWFATNFAEECDLPFVFTLFDLAHLEHPWFPEVSHNGEWERREHHYRRFLPKAAAVIVPNKAGAEELKRHFSIGDGRILILGHPTPGFALEGDDRPALRAVLDEHGIRQPYLFYPAQFWAHKNHLTLVETLAVLRARGRDFQAVCVGSDRGQLDHVRSLARQLRVHGAVHLLGFVDTDELIGLYKHAHALVYLSFFGPENLPPLEALALGCPVVAAAVHGAREQLGNAALLVPPTDPEGVADAIERLEDEQLRAELRTRGRRRVSEVTPAAYVEGVINFLDRFERIRACW